jgi:LPS-assembly protein
LNLETWPPDHPGRVGIAAARWQRHSSILLWLSILAGFLVLWLAVPLGAQEKPDWLVEDPILGAPGQSPEQEAPEEVVPEGEEAEPSEQAELGLDRIHFQVPFPEDKGGGIATGTAGSLEYVREDYIVATGGVELRYQDLKFQGQRVALDMKSQQVTAEGDVILDQGPKRLIGETLVFDLETKTGTLTDAKAYVDPDIFFEGREITKLGEDRYAVTDGLLTSCIDDVPDWNFRLSKGTVELEGFARIKNARFRVKKAPFLYFPYILYPAKTERTSGLLFPNFGYSQNRGAVLGLAYFQTLGDSYDTTFYAHIYTEEYFGFGNEFRYRPSEYTRGFFEGYVIEDQEGDDLRWKVLWVHKSDRLPLGMRAVLRYQDFSDFNFFRDFERDFDNATIRRLLSSGFLTGNWGQHSFTLLVEENETFIARDDLATKRQLPEAEYRLRPTQIGRLPLYLDLISSVNYFNSQRTDRFDNTWGRADFFPNLTASLSTLPWLSFSVTAGERVTWYSDSEGESSTELSGDSLTRTFTSAASDIVGPSFSRVFDKKIGRFGKFKHIIEPRWTYRFIDDFEDQDLVLQFDEIDRLRPLNVFSYNFVNRLLAKPVDEEEHGGAREVMLLEIGQSFSLDDSRPLQFSGGEGPRETTDGPIFMRYRFNPRTDASLEAKTQYNTLFDRLTSASLSGAMDFGRHGVGLTWFSRFNQVNGNTTGNQLRLFAGLAIWPDHFRVDAQINYDFVTDLLQSQRYIFQYFSQCFGFRLELREFRTTARRDRDFRFAVTLKNIGTFLDLTGGTRSGFNPTF